MRLYSKFFFASLLTIGAADLLSRAVFFLPPAMTAVTTVIAITVLIAALYRFEWGIYAIVAELMIGGKGYLFSLPVGGGRLSLRMVLFLLVISVWMSRRLLENLEQKRHRFDFHPYILPSLMAAIVAFSTVRGLQHFSTAQVFFDANAWLFFLLLGAFASALSKPEHFERIVQLGCAAAIVISLKTGVLLYFFGHSDPAAIAETYQWVRNSGVGEITQVSDTLFRIFMQSHIYALITWLTVMALLISRALRRTDSLIIAGITLYLSGFALLTSQSRSLWIGWAVGMLFLGVLAMLRYALSPGRMVILVMLIVVIVQSQLALLSFVSGSYGGNIINKRFGGMTQEPASSSRQHQLRPLITAIAEHPWLGSGFGRTVTYTSMDPRVRKEYPDGKFTTAAFEWGYLDIALKTGVIGLLLYVVWLFTIIQQCLAQKNSHGSLGGIRLGLVCGLIGVVVTNIFTPYLNHPLGIGYVLLCFSAARAAQTTP